MQEGRKLKSLLGGQGVQPPEALFFNILNIKLLLGHITLAGPVHNVRSHFRTNVSMLTDCEPEKGGRGRAAF